MTARRGLAGAVLVVRAWRDGPGAGDLRARVWRAVGRGAALVLTERSVSSLTELEQVVDEWLDRVADDEWDDAP